jgi:phage terminase small subunit
MKKLTGKQERFVAEYLVSLNATDAARKAGYSAGSAAVIGCENLMKPNIKAVIDAEMEKRAERTRVDADKVVKELAKVGFSDLRELAKWDEGGVRWRNSSELEDDAAASVKDLVFTHEVRYDKNGERIETTNTKLQLHDKMAALKSLAQHTGILNDTTQGVGILADTFLAGANTVERMLVEDKSE